MKKYVETLGGEFRIRIPDTVGKYAIAEVIGTGSCAVVCRGINPTTKEEVCAKFVDREGITKNGMLARFESELRIHQKLDHPNVAKILNVVYLKDIIVVIMEYCKKGDMHDMLNYFSLIQVKDKLHIMKQICDGLAYLHSRGISHRDIKPENIVFTRTFQPKFIDFGMATEGAQTLKDICGTPFFISPEVIKDKNYNPFKADIFSLGVTLHTFLTGVLPWQDESEEKYMQNLLRNRIRPTVLVEGRLNQIIASMLSKPECRPSAEELRDVFEMMDGNQISPVRNALTEFTLRKYYSENTRSKIHEVKPKALIIRPQHSIGTKIQRINGLIAN